MSEYTVRYDPVHIGKKIRIDFPYDEELNELGKKEIPRFGWDRERGVWRCPLTSLPEVIEVFEPEGFEISRRLKERLPEIKKKKKRKEADRKAKEKLQQRIEAGDQVAFVPSANNVLTRKLKRNGPYKIVREKSRFGSQTAGYKVPEEDLKTVLSNMGVPTAPRKRLCEWMSYTWRINREAKEKGYKYSSKDYRYSKKEKLLEELCRLAPKQEAYQWGWKMDPDPPPNAPWVLYFQREGSQCSFHSVSGRGEGPDFPGEWDGMYHEEFPFENYLSKEKRLFE